METQTHMHRMGLNPFLMFYIDAMLNFDGDVNANANVKCEHTLTKWLFISQTSSPGIWYVVVRGGSRIPRRKVAPTFQKGAPTYDFAKNFPKTA